MTSSYQEYSNRAELSIYTRYASHVATNARPQGRGGEVTMVGGAPC